MHARLQGGALYNYAIVDDKGREVGAESVTINKKTKPWTSSSAYKLIGDETVFTDRKSFIAAYLARGEKTP